jgi:hypothetical protein
LLIRNAKKWCAASGFAHKCNKCIDGYRHEHGYCVLCGASAYSDLPPQFFDELPVRPADRNKEIIFRLVALSVGDYGVKGNFQAPPFDHTLYNKGKTK